MSVAAAVAAAVVFVVLLHRPIRHRPVVFYAAAIGLDLLLVLGHQAGVPVFLWRAVLGFHSRCLFAFSLFVIVMFTGVLRNGSRMKSVLLPIRAELSLIASLLVLGHVVAYASSYANRLLAPASPTAVLASAVAALLVLLLVPLAITSAKAVKRRMAAGSWRSLQRTAYLFWGLVFAHVLVMLGPSALSGADSARMNILAYFLVFAAYLILRIRRLVLDSRERESRC